MKKSVAHMTDAEYREWYEAKNKASLEAERRIDEQYRRKRREARAAAAAKRTSRRQWQDRCAAKLKETT